jgi:hypothetical protein
MSADVSWLRNSILHSGRSFRICRAALIPFSVGRPMSSTTRSGRSSSTFCSASSPSEASPTICHSGFCRSVERINRRNGSKSSTMRIRTGDISKVAFVLSEAVGAESPMFKTALGRHDQRSARRSTINCSYIFQTRQWQDCCASGIQNQGKQNKISKASPAVNIHFGDRDFPDSYGC